MVQIYTALSPDCCARKEYGMAESDSSRPRRAKGIRLNVVERFYERGLHHFTKERHDLALADLDEAIMRAPRTAELYAARGLVALQAGWDVDAEADFVQALKIDPAQWIAHYGRGMQAFQQRDYRSAIDHFSRAQQLAPERPEIYYHRAVAFYEVNNIDQAILDMDAAKALFADNKKRLTQTLAWLRILEQARLT